MGKEDLETHAQVGIGGQRNLERGAVQLGTALGWTGRAGASPCVPWPYCTSAECAFRGLCFYCVKLWSSLLFTTQPYNAFVPFRFVITDGENYVMEEFKIGCKVQSIYSSPSGLINFEVWKQKLSVTSAEHRRLNVVQLRTRVLLVTVSGRKINQFWELKPGKIHYLAVSVCFTSGSEFWSVPLMCVLERSQEIV